jgi:hypothetical protein
MGLFAALPASKGGFGMGWPELAWDIGKYVLTGLLSFIAALAWTEFRLRPARNVSLVPLLMEKHSVCRVDSQKLSETIRRLGLDTADPSEEDSYALYLKALWTSAEESRKWVVQKRLVPQDVIPQLDQDGVLTCELLDPNKQQDYRYHTFLVVQVAVLLNEPIAYVFRRSCTLLYQGEEIPLRASVEEVPLSELHGFRTDPEILVIGQTRTIFLQYDTQEADRIHQDKFTDLIKKMDEKKVEVTIRCTVIQERGEQLIGRPKPPFIVSVRTAL